MDLIKSCHGLIGKLTSSQQCGKSLWGLLVAPTLPFFIGGHEGTGAAGVAPWLPRTANGSNPYHDCPKTEVVRSYDWTISRGWIAPDGYNKSVILVNGQFPGPLVEANWGDWIEVKVHNNITEDTPEGTAIHWHGFLQNDTPWMDGVPGVSQCPIAPGKSFTYKFRAELYGSSWYHSHLSAQYSGGLFGPIVVYGPTNAKYDIDLGPIMVNDWWHEDYFSTVEKIMAPNASGLTFSDNNLINGRMNFDCSTVAEGDNTNCTRNAGLSKFRFESGKSHRLRLVNTGSEGTQRISIDEHNMTVMAYDFVEIEPYETNVITLGVGQRADVIVHADKDSRSAFWLRANMTSCSLTTQPFALAAIYYEDADPNSVPRSTPWNVPDPGTCANDDLTTTKPFYPMAVQEPSWTQNMDIAAFRNASGNFLWSFGGVSARVNFNDPTLLQVNNNDLDFTRDMHVMNFGTNSSIRFIVNNPTPAAHPIHAHGLNMFILAQGAGTFDGGLNSSTPLDRAYLRNPMRRDVHMVSAFSHIVVQMTVENPGLWPFHCHVAWHASGGFFSQMLFLPDEIQRYDIPAEVEQGCRDWDAFTDVAIPNQIDSGL